MPKTIPQKEASEHIEQMLDLLYEKDSFLLKRSLNISERAITHRMGMYLQQIIGDDFDVDCEYNRMGRCENGEFEYTHGDYFAKNVCLAGKQVPDDDDNGSRVYPDIIVHKRGTAKNYIIIEVKVEWKNGDTGHDKKKLSAYQGDLGYGHAFYIELSEKRQDVKVDLI